MQRPFFVRKIRVKKSEEAKNQFLSFLKDMRIDNKKKIKFN